MSGGEKSTSINPPSLASQRVFLTYVFTRYVLACSKKRSHLTTHLTSENRLILEYLGQCNGRAPASLDVIWFLFFSAPLVLCVYPGGT